MTRRRLVSFDRQLADGDDIPLLVVCSVCGARWQRPEGDPSAATLEAWAIQHTYDHHAQQSLDDGDW